MYTASEIAEWFIIKTNAEIKTNQAENDMYDVYEGLTHLKLQKLLYFAQGVHLAYLDKPLFDDPIEAWSYGPVVKAVYDQYQKFKREPIKIEITKQIEKLITQISMDSETYKVLEFVYDNFAIYTAWKLVEMAHADGTPWLKAKENNEKIINQDDIKKYFSEEVLN